MNYDKENNRLNQIKIENFIWIVYIGIIVLSFYSNKLEKDYFLFNDLIAKQKYRKILIIIFSILIIVYFYFLKDTFDDLKNLKENDSNEKKNLIFLSFIGSLLIFISGIIFLYIAYKDENINVELAFN